MAEIVPSRNIIFVWSPGAKRFILNRNKSQFLVGASELLRLGVCVLGTWNMFGR